MKKLLFFGLLSVFVFQTMAQKAWSFDDCVQHAIQNNIQIQQNKLNVELASNNVLQGKMGLYTPNINANITEGFNFANSVDPLTYQFIQQSTNSTTLGLFLDFSLFEGFSRIQNLRADNLTLDAAQLEQTELENNTKLSIANFYLNVLLANEALQIIKEQQILTQNQYNNTKELVKAGVLAAGDQYEVEAQIANNELNLVNAEINLENALNQLKLVLQLNPFEDFIVEGLIVDAIDVEQDFEFNENTSQFALNNLPNLKSAQLRIQAAQQQLKATKGSLSPSLSFSAYLGSNYFSAAQQQVGSSQITTPIGIVSGTNQLVLTSYEQPVFGDKSFGQQVGDNFNQNIRLNLSIPIFGKWQRMIAIDNAKLNVLKSSLDLQSKTNSLQQEIFTAQSNVKAASKKYLANQKNLEAASVAFTYAEEKFKVGIINSYEFETVKNRLMTAQTNLVQAKFEYVFRKMMANFYETGTLTL
jgi:outer membrane protein